MVRMFFRVTGDATKPESTKLSKRVLKSKVESVHTLNHKGKIKRTCRGLGKRKSVKKAYVRLAEGQDIDFMVADKGR